MESALKIIDAIYRGVSPQELAREFPWEEIIGDSALELLKFAQHSPDNQQSFQILAYLFRVASGNDLWFATEVLSQTVRHPILSADERRMILANLRSLLDKIKEQNSVEPPTQENLHKYLLMEGGYYTVSGAILAETGKAEEANQNYAIAQGIFEQLGLILPGMKYSNGGITLPASDHAQPAAEDKSKTIPMTENMKPAELQEASPPVQPPQDRQPAPERPAAEDLETFHALPDVWFENGQLHLPAVEKTGGDEIRQQALQIEQQSEILAGIQMQIQMYLSRRSVLAKEVQALERKSAALKAAIARQVKKVDAG
jgi:hypothetical protein